MREGLDLDKMEWGRKKTQVKKSQFLELIGRVEVLEKEVARLNKIIIQTPVQVLAKEPGTKNKNKVPVKKVVKKAV